MARTRALYINVTMGNRRCRCCPDFFLVLPFYYIYFLCFLQHYFLCTYVHLNYSTSWYVIEYFSAHLVCRGDVLEALGRRLVPLVLVRVVLQRQLPVRLLDLPWGWMKPIEG